MLLVSDKDVRREGVALSHSVSGNKVDPGRCIGKEISWHLFRTCAL